MSDTLLRIALTPIMFALGYVLIKIAAAIVYAL